MLSYSICMRVCAHAHVDMWTCGHVYTCVHVEVHLRCCSWRSIHLFTRTWNSPVRLGWPVRQPQHWDYRGVPHLAFLCGFWDWTQVFTLAQQELYHLSCLPIPSINHWRYGPWHLVRHILLDAEGMAYPSLKLGECFPGLCNYMSSVTQEYPLTSLSSKEELASKRQIFDKNQCLRLFMRGSWNPCEILIWMRSTLFWYWHVYWRTLWKLMLRNIHPSNPSALCAV